MQRRDFLRNGVALAAAAKAGIGGADGIVPAHNWGNYDFGSGPTVTDRLDEHFPQYPPDAVIPTDDVVMTTTPTDDVVPNYGKGLVTYITADMGTEEIKSDNVPQAIEDLVKFPLGQQLYISRLARNSAETRPPRAPRISQAGFCTEQTNWQTHRTARADVRAGLAHAPALPDFGFLEKRQ